MLRQVIRHSLFRIRQLGIQDRLCCVLLFQAIRTLFAKGSIQLCPRTPSVHELTDHQTLKGKHFKDDNRQVKAYKGKPSFLIKYGTPIKKQSVYQSIHFSS